MFVRRAADDQNARPVLFVHGLGGQSTNFTDVMALLRHRFSCVAPDLPGFGHSPPPDAGNYRLDAAVRNLADVLRHERRDQRGPLTVVGNSLGGALAVRLAALHPDLVDRLVLISPALPDLRPHRGVVLVPFLALPRVGERFLHHLSRVPVERQVDAMLRMNYGDPTVVPGERRRQIVEEYRRRLGVEHSGAALSATARGLLIAFAQLGRRALWRQAESLRCPTLLIYGGKDALVDVRRARRAARSIVGSRLVVLPRTGHLAQAEQPELVARLILAFSDSLDDASGHSLPSRP